MGVLLGFFQGAGAGGRPGGSVDPFSGKADASTGPPSAQRTPVRRGTLEALDRERDARDATAGARVARVRDDEAEAAVRMAAAHGERPDRWRAGDTAPAPQGGASGVGVGRHGRGGLEKEGGDASS
ncbi:MAG TPA: hypothetical protein VFZ93_00105, partial [Albitalea sp.]